MVRSFRLVRVVLLAALLVAVSPAVVSARGLRIKRIAVSGNSTLSTAALQRALSPLVPRGHLSRAARARVALAVRRRVVSFLRGNGYLKGRATVREVRPGAHTSFVLLRVALVEGARHRVGALDVTGVGPKLRLAALTRVRLRSGQFLDAAETRTSRERVATLFADRGHAFVDVKVVQKPHPTRALVDVTFRVKPGPRATIGKVVVLGATSTGAVLVRRALLVKPGSKYHRSNLRASVARLRRTGAFRSVRLTESRLGPKKVKLTVTVVESKR